MSAFISFVSPEGAMLLTDAALYDIATGILVDFRCKVHVARSVPVAVTFRGQTEWGNVFAQSICERADEVGAAAFIEGLQSFVNDYQRAHAHFTDSCQFLVSAFIHGEGGAHRSFDTTEKAANPAVGVTAARAAYQVFTPPDTMVSGTGIRRQDIIEHGLEILVGETKSNWFRRCAVDLMEVVRLTRNWQTGEPGLMAGGWCDLTTITAAGCTTETIRRWPEDRIGERIDPFRAPPVLGMNRKQRRAMGAAS